MTAFAVTFPIRFAHVDPAGIVFYPRYFELLNAAVEDWFAAMGSDFRALHLDARLGTPTVSLTIDFTAPAQLGDRLTFVLDARHVGRSSCRYGFAAAVDDQKKLSGEAVLVCMDLDRRRAVPWPGPLRAALEAALMVP